MRRFYLDRTVDKTGSRQVMRCFYLDRAGDVAYMVKYSHEYLYWLRL